MSLSNEFKILTQQFDESIFQIFKKVIDEAKEEAQKNDLDSILTFISINDKIKYCCIQLALANGIIENENDYNESHNSLIISENLLKKIYTYIEPITEKAKNEITCKVKSISNSNSVEDLQNACNNLFSLLSNKTIQENAYLYQTTNIYTDKESYENNFNFIKLELPTIKKKNK